MTTAIPVSSVPSTLSLYQSVEDRCNTRIDDTNPDAPKVIIDDHWYFGRMGVIDEFVTQTLNTQRLGYTEHTGNNGRTYWHQQDWIKPYFRSITGAISPYIDQQFDIRNVHVELFLVACKELRILDWATHLLSLPGNRDEANASAFNRLIETIRGLSKTSPYPSMLWHANNDWKDNLKSCLDYLEELFERRSRYTVVRLDLSYLKEFSFDIFTAEAKADFNRLRRKMNRAKYLKKDCWQKELFEDLAGQVWKLEYGTDRMLHFHVFLFFTRKNGQRAPYWAQEIGEYWKKEITGGRGHFDNVNRRWVGNPREGIGQVDRNDSQKRQNLEGAIRYLFKIEQCLPIRKADPRYRTFGKGL